MDIYTHIDEEAQQVKVSQWLEEDLSDIMAPAKEAHQKRS